MKNLISKNQTLEEKWFPGIPFNLILLFYYKKKYQRKS